MSDLAERAATRWNGAILLLGRILLAAIFLPSGFGKLTNLTGFASGLAGHGIPLPYAFAVLGGAVEFFGSLAVLLGFKTRPAALLMALFTVVAALISHRYWELADAARTTQYIQFMKDVAIAGGFLCLFAAGGGALSLDRRGK